MAGELCAVLLQAFYLTVDSTTVIGVFLIMWYIIYFTCTPIASSFCDTEHPPFIKICIKSLYIQYLHSFIQYLHIWWLLLLVYLIFLLYRLYIASNHDIFY